GYDVVDGDKPGGGYRRINTTEAAVVRRIFTLYADGMSPRAIARLLNDEGVTGPTGGAWLDTTIRGQVARGTGILNNVNYVGVLSWGRCEFIKNPGTGKRVARINPQEKRETVEIPELRIVDDALWNRVKTRQEAVATEIGRDDQGNALNRVHRRRFLLSGVLVCGICGAGYTIMGKDRYGCAGHRNSGTCPNDRTITRQAIERRVLAGLKERLLGADVVAAFVEEMAAVQRREQAEARNRRGDQERALAGIDRKIASILKAVEDGMYSPSLKERLSTLEAERAALATEMDAVKTEAPEMLLPANLPELYRRKVAELESVLGDGDEGMAAMEMIRAMVDRVELSPCPSGAGLEAQLYGDLAAILAACAEAGPKRQQPASGETGCQLSVVAGAGFEP
ncbi:recombinase family protein, partial [Azospirillum sp. TSH58]|uniref:recombinase family protein n=1 Tax=Azospirillum sp. TSH58 TaxID=664962 RepID=UPI000D60BD37